ncbi:hypothetical protein [Methylocystis sp.]|uniref:hypothetical protein n=1 Tax=Methylocystis sp. TaxID=1911079 RepID=UPI003DA629BE
MNVVDETEIDLKRLVEIDFGPFDSSTDLWRAILDWIHFRARRVHRRSRHVTMSPEVFAKRSSFPSIGQIADAISLGDDVSPWLSDSIRDDRSNPKADLMFNDWQINHFHLGRIFSTPDSARRTGNLLFAYLNRNHAVLLDIQPHGTWTMQMFLEILFRTSPSDILRYELKGVIGTTNSYTADEMYELRKCGMSTFFQIDGRVFMPPGGGLVTSGHALRFVRFLNLMRRTHRTLLEQIRGGTLPRNLLMSLAANVGLPVRLGVRMAADELIFFDKNRNFVLVHLPLPH